MTNENNQPEIHYLGFNSRFVAFLIDSTAASLLMAPFVSHLIGDLVLSDKDLSNQSELLALLGSMATRLSVDLVFMGTIFILLDLQKFNARENVVQISDRRRKHLISALHLSEHHPIPWVFP